MSCQAPRRIFPRVPKSSSRDAVCAAVAVALRKERERQSLSMNAVAERAGLSQQMVSYVERGMRNPTLDTLLRITEALDIELALLLQRATKAATKS